MTTVFTLIKIRFWLAIDENGIKIKKTRDGTLIYHNGFTFKLKYVRTKSALYWCTLHRKSDSDCYSKLKMYKETGFKEALGFHGRHCIHRNRSNLNKRISPSPLVDNSNLPPNPAKKMILDYTEDMHEKVIHLTSSDVSFRTKIIWKILSDEMNTR